MTHRLKSEHSAVSVAIAFATCLSVAAQDGGVSAATEWIKKGEQAAAGGHWQEASRNFFEAVNKDGNNAIGLYNLGIAYFHLGDLSKAQVAEEQAIVLKPEFASAYVQLATILLKSGDRAGAEQRLRKALELEPSNETAKANLNVLLGSDTPVNEKAPANPQPTEQKAADVAETAKEKAANGNTGVEPRVQRDKGAAVARENHELDTVQDKIHGAKSAFEKGQFEIARQLLVAATQQDQKNSAACADLGAVMGASGDNDGEIAKERLAIELDENNAIAHFNLAWALGRKGLWTQALRENESALKINPELIEAIAGKAIAQVELGLVGEPKQVLQQALTKHDDALLLHLALAIVLQKEGNIEASESELKKAIALEPNRVETQEWVAFFKLSQQQFIEAKELYSEIVKANPEEGQSWLGLGLALEKNHEQGAALEALQKAATLSPNDAAAHMALGLALESRGRKIEASEELRMAIKLDPTYELAEAHLEKLQSRK
jgi:Flp pilus assembly protein TadD